MSTISIVVGGQNGSEGKGTVAGELARSLTGIHRGRRHHQVVGVRVGGPNAGHTIYGRCYPGCDMSSHDTRMPEHYDHQSRHPWKLRQVPVAAVTNEYAALVIAEGSEIDIEVLLQEILELDMAGYNVSERLKVDAQATVIEEIHKYQELNVGLTAKLGSTAKGIGAARAARVWRDAKLAGEADELTKWAFDGTAGYLMDYLHNSGTHIVIEGTQGYDLGLHAGHYPFCTSGNARAIDFLAQTGLSPWCNVGTILDVWVVARTKPIRVAGNSGPLENETSWEDLGLPEERTTVTNKVRRVAEFDLEQVKRSLYFNGSPNVKLALLMVDYEFPDLFGKDHVEEFAYHKPFLEWLTQKQNDLGVPVEMIGTSPVTNLAGSSLTKMWSRTARNIR